MASWLELLKIDPTDWLLEKASPPLKYRLLTEVLETDSSDGRILAAREGSMNFKPAVAISRTQQETGTWLDKVLDFEAPNPSRNRGPGLVNQFLALIEYGWDSSHPIIHASADRLMRYAMGDVHADIFELKGYTGSNAEAEASVRKLLSVISAALLSRGGYAHEAAVTEVAERVSAELEEQYPAGGEPDLYDGLIEIADDSKDDGTYRRVRDGAHVPDMFLFYLMAFHPHFAEDERGRAVRDRVADHLMKGDDVPWRIREIGGKRVMKLTDLPIGHLEQADFADHRLGLLLHDLELLARTGQLTRFDKAQALLEWVIGLQDTEDGVFRVDDQLEKFVSRSQYHYFPLEDSWRGKHKKYTDVAFRVMLILKVLDRTSPR